jgi:hypothetical protein
MTRDGDSKKADGVKDRAMKLTEEGLDELIKEFFSILGACSALKEMQDLVIAKREVPDSVSVMAGTLTEEVPMMVSMTITKLIRAKGHYDGHPAEAMMLHEWLPRAVKYQAEHADDE